ncbi:unnamed protein product [Oppiella nova]|uniref:NR LBD domain-containing protein n=1 Tax=Oppiella nova TaxID=334625 RepID=A0A7R9M3D1_9ACAR|nr:unnamed protein product [Oppiella nova]CAG2169896.1 unnamed protein product [Oppiella nova]
MPIVITGPTDKTFVDNIMDALNLLVLKCDDYIQDVIKLFKRLNSFQSICQSDQMILIKYSLLEIKILRLISNFNFEGQYWTLDTENNCSTLMKLDLFKQINFVAQPFRPYYDYKNFYQNMGLDWNSDNLIIDLLTAILLFNAERPNLINREMIKRNALKESVKS